MKKSSFWIAAGIALFITITSEAGSLSVQADSERKITSTGKIVYNSGTKDNLNPICFDASDLILLENRIKELETRFQDTQFRLGLEMNRKGEQIDEKK